MKKIYAIALLAMAAATASAQNGAPLYATGAGPAFDPAWDSTQPKEFTYADGVYTLELDGLSSFAVSSVKGEGEDPWSVFNTGRIYCEYGSEPGVEVALVPGDGNINTPWQGKYKVTIKGDLSTVILTTDSERPETHIYLRGDMNNWLNDAIKDGEITDEAMAAKWELTKEGETNVFYLNLAEPVAAGLGFKVADANWANINLGKNSETDPDPLMLELPYTLVPNGDNIAIDEEWSGSVVLNLDTYEITFSNEKYEPAQGGVANMAVENGEAVYFNLQGVRVNAPENGIYIVVKDGKAMKVVK